MRKGSSWFGLAAAGLLAVTVTGCPKEKTETSPAAGSTSGSGSAGGATAATENGSIKIAVIPKGTAHSFWQTVKLGADAAGAEEKVEIIWQGPDKEGDITQQINLVQTQVTNKISGLVLAATDSNSLVRPLKDAQAKGVPVVTIDSGVNDPNASLCYIATDNVEGGRRAADALAKELGEKGKVGVLLFQKGSASNDEREKGFLENIKKYPNIKIVSSLEGSDAQKANDNTTNMITSNPDLNGIFAANEPNGVGAAAVLKQKGLAGKVKLVAYDSSPEELKALEEGSIQALVVQDPFQMGYLGVKTVLKAIRKQQIDKKTIDSGMTVVTKANLSDPKVQKLVNPPIPKK